MEEAHTHEHTLFTDVEGVQWQNEGAGSVEGGYTKTGYWQLTRIAIRRKSWH